MKKIKCEQLNVNDDSYKVVDLPIENGIFVKKNLHVLSLETSKASYDLEAEFEGYFYTALLLNNNISPGELLYIILDNKIESDQLQKYFDDDKSIETADDNLTEKTITDKAKLLIKTHNLSIDDFNNDFITEEVVLEKIGKSLKTELVKSDSNYNNFQRIAFIGAGQGLIQCLDIVFNLPNLIPVCIYDDNSELHGKEICGIPIKGSVNISNIIDDFKMSKFDKLVITVSTSIKFRESTFTSLLASGLDFANLIHPSVIIGFNVKIGSGNIILSNVSIGPCTNLGNNNFISSKCNLEHHNSIGDNNTFGPGVMTSGDVSIASENKFGTGIFIEPHVKIGSSSLIASGSIIVKNIDNNVLVYPENSKINIRNLNT